MHGKNFEKINTKIITQILQCTPDLSFTQFRVYSILVLNESKKHFREEPEAATGCVL